jgi:hypothetical protein
MAQATVQKMLRRVLGRTFRLSFRKKVRLWLVVRMQLVSAAIPVKLCVGKELVRETTNQRESHFRAFATDVHVAHLVEALTASSRVKSFLTRFKNGARKSCAWICG